MNNNSSSDTSQYNYYTYKYNKAKSKEVHEVKVEPSKVEKIEEVYIFDIKYLNLKED